MGKPVSMDIGSLRKQVQIQALPASPDTDPNWNEQKFDDWTTLATVWASVEPLSGKELVFAGQVAADATHQVTIRYYQGLSPKMRFLYIDDMTSVNRIFNIAYVKDVDERHVVQQCLCHEDVT